LFGLERSGGLGGRFTDAEPPCPGGPAKACHIGRGWIAGEACTLALGGFRHGFGTLEPDTEPSRRAATGTSEPQQAEGVHDGIPLAAKGPRQAITLDLHRSGAAYCIRVNCARQSLNA